MVWIKKILSNGRVKVIIIGISLVLICSMSGLCHYPYWQLDHVLIKGSTSISSFELEFNQELGDYSMKVDEGVVSYLIPVVYFTNSNRLLVHDFRKILNSTEFPYILIEIPKITMRDLQLIDGVEDICVEVVVAGKRSTNKVKIYHDCLYEKPTFVSGNTKIYMSDYKLKGKILGGVIKLNNEVEVCFNLVK